MQLSEQEKAANRAAFRAMTPGQKADYIYSYYKLPLVLALIVVVALGSVAWKLITHKDAVLYEAFVNVVPPAEVDEALTVGFVEKSGADARHQEILAYRELYLTNDTNLADHQYAYASRLKLMAAIEGEQLDVVLMNQEGYDLLSASGYLMDLGSSFAGDELLCTNTVVLSSNEVEVNLGEADELEAQTIEEANALRVTGLPMLGGFAGDEELYLGVIANTPRTEKSLEYLRYVVSQGDGSFG